MPERELTTEERERLWQHALHEDSLYNERLNSFLIFHSVLLAVGGTILGSRAAAIGPLLIVLSCAGIALSFLWLYAQTLVSG
jgi:hypothetical protein